MYSSSNKHLGIVFLIGAQVAGDADESRNTSRASLASFAATMFNIERSAGFFPHNLIVIDRQENSSRLLTPVYAPSYC